MHSLHLIRRYVMTAKQLGVSNISPRPSLSRITFRQSLRNRLVILTTGCASIMLIAMLTSMGAKFSGGKAVAAVQGVCPPARNDCLSSGDQSAINQRLNARGYANLCPNAIF